MKALAAVLIEPMMGAGGCIPARQGVPDRIAPTLR